MFENATNSKKQGDVGLGAAIAYFTRMGLTVSLPLTDSQDYDIIVDVDGKLNRVQVKTTSYKNQHGTFVANISTKGGNRSFNTIKKFNHDKVDSLFVLTSEGDAYWIPVSAFACKNHIALSNRKTEFKIESYSLPLAVT